MSHALQIWIAVSVILCLVQGACAVAVLRRRPRSQNTSFLPPVSILKPLKGTDDRLLENLERFCRLDYPEYEIVFCVQGENDPALRVARKIRDMHPDRDISIVVGSYHRGLNPKVNNLIPGYRAARHPYVLISDSNVRPRPGYLREAVSHLEDPGVGMVTHLVRGVGAQSLGARLENGHLNSFILPSVVLLDRLLKWPCVVGKSMLMRKADLERVGGLEAVQDVLAEDYVLGSRFRQAGMRVVVSALPVDNMNMYRSVGDFASRHLRWNRMRLWVAGPGYLAEPLSSPLVPALLNLAVTGFSLKAWIAAIFAAGAKLVADSAVSRALGIRGRTGDLLVGPARDLVAFGLWFWAFFGRTVEWRGRTLRITRGSRLVPTEPGPAPIRRPEPAGSL